jgi:hypothetical protein
MDSEILNNNLNDTEPSGRNMTWQAQPSPSQCAHRHEVIAQEEGVALKRCAKCGSLEAA